MTTEHICIMIAIIVYLGAMLYVGYRCSKNNHDTTDFYLGGRKLGPLVTAMSAEASDMSSWLLMGLPGLAYLTGIADAGWTAIGLAIGTYINWRIVAKRIRRYTLVAGNSITLPSFFSNRYRDQRKILQSIGAIFIVIFFIPYTASGFAACGKLFSSLFGVNYVAAMIISAIVIVGYTALGGFLAASTTDFIQSIIMSVALIIVFIFGINIAGGIPAVVENAQSLPGYLTMMTTYRCRCRTALSDHQYYFHDRMGARLLRYASYPASLHGYRGRRKTHALQTRCDNLGCHFPCSCGFDRCDRSGNERCRRFKNFDRFRF